MNKFLYDPSLYTGFRPQYPSELFEYLKKMSKDDVVLECGAGSGQGTAGLSKYFKFIIATDLSFDLLSQAAPFSHVCYVQSLAEKLPISSSSINLICIAQAIHWFSLDDFYSEAKRILTPQGMIAAWGYNQAMIEPEIDNVIKKVYSEIISSQNFSPMRQYLYDHYETIPFPFKKIPTPSFSMKMQWDLMQWLGYMNTWPGVLEYQKRFNINLVSKIEDELGLVWGNPLDKKIITWPIFLLLGHVI